MGTQMYPTTQRLPVIKRQLHEKYPPQAYLNCYGKQYVNINIKLYYNLFSVFSSNYKSTTFFTLFHVLKLCRKQLCAKLQNQKTETK